MLDRVTKKLIFSPNKVEYVVGYKVWLVGTYVRRYTSIFI